MSGAYGRILHVAEDGSLTFSDLKEVLASAAEGRLERVTEKTDGQNLLFTFDVDRDELRVARSHGDVLAGGMGAPELAAKFAGRGNVASAFNNAFRILKNASVALSDGDKLAIFGANGGKWYSAEVIYTQNPNVVNYDSNTVVFHGNPTFRCNNGKVIRVEDDRSVDVLLKNVGKMQEMVNQRGWLVKGPLFLSLRRISDGSVLSDALEGVSEAMASMNMCDGNTIGEYRRAWVSELIRVLNVPENVVTMLAARCVDTDLKGVGREIKKFLSKDQLRTAEEFVEEYRTNIWRSQTPLDATIRRFSIDVLRGIASSMVSDSDEEIRRRRAAVVCAISAIEASGDERALTVLRNELVKLGSLDNISTAVEGIVFRFKGNTYKFTGSFSPVNRILGVLRYNR